MRPSTEARFGVRLLLALQIVTSLAGVMLLGRMSPAVEQILTDNVYSTEAVEEMLEVLATDGEAERFHDALTRAENNITEAEEVPLLERIGASADGALSGDRRAAKDVIAALRELAQVNRASMRRADARASRLGLAGAWAMALLGFLGFLLALVVTRRIERRLLTPILEVDAVLADARAGDTHRRCVRADADAGGQLVDNLNWLLDRLRPADPRPAEDGALRAALVALLDRVVDVPAVLIDDEGALVAVNAVALDEGVRAAEVVAHLDTDDADGWHLEKLGHGVSLATRAA